RPRRCALELRHLHLAHWARHVRQGRVRRSGPQRDSGGHAHVSRIGGSRVHRAPALARNVAARLAGELRQGPPKDAAATLSQPAVGTATTIEVAPETIRLVRARLLPVLFSLYVVAFLDRINIGFAPLTMNRELGISSQPFGFLVGVFFFGYCLFEVPSNLLLHRIGARIWIARILVSWGIVAVLMGFARSISELYLARFLLGIGEAGFFPGIVLYLTYWFPERERARAIAFFLTAQPITSILGAPFSGVILDHVHWLGLSSWRWLLILEGIPALIGGFAAYRLLPNRPADATF